VKATLRTSSALKTLERERGNVLGKGFAPEEIDGGQVNRRMMAPRDDVRPRNPGFTKERGKSTWVICLSQDRAIVP